MNFTITARVVSQLGAELISSDEVAIYELVKNGFDAGSQVVEVNVNYRLDATVIKAIQSALFTKLADSDLESAIPQDAKLNAIQQLNALAGPETSSGRSLLLPNQLGELKEKLIASATVRQFLQVLGRTNSIDIVDYGCGMSADEVRRYYLTIGTTHRLQELKAIDAEAPPRQVPAGEKGIGRLSAMRLGHELEMFTVPAEADQAVLVAVHWRDFEMLIDRDLTQVPVEVEIREKGGTSPGTVITISDLHSAWPRHRVAKLASDHLAKFLDPFPALDAAANSRPPDQLTRSRQPRTVVLRWNGEVLDATAALRRYLENCSNSFKCKVRVSQHGPTELETEFFFSESGSHQAERSVRNYSVIDFAGFTEEQLKLIGPFEFALYHYPRNKLKAIPQFATRPEFKGWLDNWCGGLMVFRDGVRVLPYATPGDDWLDLDEKALRGQGFRVNRIQVVGFVRISRLQNPGLVDQTNREGLRDNESFQAFKELIRQHIHRNFVPRLNQHLSDAKPDWAHLASRVQAQQDSLSETIEGIDSAVRQNDLRAVGAATQRLAEFSQQLREVNEIVEAALAEKEASKLEILELAATGMSAEAMAHDLEGAVESAVATLGELARLSAEKTLVASITHLRAVHKSLLTQIKQLSPGPAKSRRRASTFDLVQVVVEAAQLYKERCDQLGIAIELPADDTTFIVHAVNGHVRQILDNFFRNSIFWVQDTKAKFPEISDHSIRITADTVARQLRFTDTGVGIAKEDVEWVFRPFTTRRGDGRGLGLYICKELADFNGIKLYPDSQDVNRWGRLRTLLLEFPEASKR